MSPGIALMPSRRTRSSGRVQLGERIVAEAEYGAEHPTPMRRTCWLLVADPHLVERVGFVQGTRSRTGLRAEGGLRLPACVVVHGRWPPRGLGKRGVLSRRYPSPRIALTVGNQGIDEGSVAHGAATEGGWSFGLIALTTGTVTLNEASPILWRMHRFVARAAMEIGILRSMEVRIVTRTRPRCRLERRVVRNEDPPSISGFYRRVDSGSPAPCMISRQSAGRPGLHSPNNPTVRSGCARRRSFSDRRFARTSPSAR